MNISTCYNIGDTVFFKCIRTPETSYIDGEIVRISVYKSKDAYNIRYAIQYFLEGQTLMTDRWEEDLCMEDADGRKKWRGIFSIKAEKEG